MSKSLNLLAIAATGALALAGCVDHDYDLTEDIDMTVQAGGDLCIPASSTDIITLAQILDLDEGSSIIEMKTAADVQAYGLPLGDYALVQAGSSEPANFEVGKIKIDGVGSSKRTTVDTFYGAGTIEVVQPVTATINQIDLHKNDVTHELVRLDGATLKVDMRFKIGYESNDFSGALTIKAGYQAVFDDEWTLELPDAATAQFLELVDGHTLRFKTDYDITPTHPLDAKIRLAAVNFRNSPDQGLVAPGVFNLVSNVISSGDVALKADQLAFGAAANIVLLTTTSVDPDSEIVDVTGVVDPTINVDPTGFAISGVPDFLKDEENSLDIDNPRIIFTVANNSPLTLSVRAKIKAYDAPNAAAPSQSVEIGYAQVIEVHPNATTTYVICCHDVPGDAWFADKEVIVVPDLNNLIKTVPDHLELADVDCRAKAVPVTFNLGHTYTYNATYEAFVPLAFGPDMRLHYTDIENDWDEDLDDYNFNEVHVTATALNTLPLSMTPQVVALDRAGNDMTDITATITDAEGNPLKIGAGAIDAPTSTDLTIVLRSTAPNMGRLDGVRLVFDGYDPKVGVNLNSGQSLRFENIAVRLKGGVIVDLN